MPTVPIELDDAPPASRLLRMTQRSAIWEIAWPVIVIGLVRSGYFLADAFWAGRMGVDAPAALSAMGGAAFATWILQCLGDLAAVGTHARVAHAAGRGDSSAVGRAALQGLWVSVALGLVMAVFTRPLTQLYFALLGFDGPGFERARVMGTELLLVFGYGMVVLTLHNVAGSVFRGLGDTRTPLFVSIGSLAMNAALAPVLMFGVGPFPALGLAGAAWATVLANAAAFVASLVVLARLGTPVPIGRPVLAEAYRIAAIGLPQAVSGVGFCFVYVVLGETIAQFGPSAIAGLGLGHRLESPAYQVCVGFGAAAATLVGQNTGARDLRAAARGAHTAARLCCLAMLPFALVFLGAPRVLMSVWTSDAATLREGASYLFFVGLVVMPMALEVVYESAFAGAGKTLPAMIVILTLTAARIPAALFLCRVPGLGARGVWIAIAVTTALKGIALLLWFRARYPTRQR